MKKWLLGVGIIVAAGLVITGLLWSSGPSDRAEDGTPAGAAERRFPVNTVTISQQAVRESVSAHGTLTARHHVPVIPKTGGRVEAIMVRVGDAVEAGDVLVQLETDELRLQKQQAEAGLQIAQASLERTLAGARQQEIMQAEASLEQARANRANAEQTYRRAQRLYDEGAMSGTEFDGAATQYEVAQAQFQTALKSLELVTQGARAEDIAQARASVVQAEASYGLAALAMEHASVRSPLDGVVSRVDAERGALVGATSPVASVINLSEAKLLVKLGERDVVRVAPEQSVEVAVNVLPGSPVTGVVDTVAPAVDESGMFPVSIIVPNEEGRLRAGMSATARIVVAEQKDALAVPVGALVTVGGTRGVYRVEDGKAHFIEVATGIQSRTHVEILSGLASGDEVVVVGMDFLRDGVPVDVRERSDSL